jgi:hypothetical protein
LGRLAVGLRVGMLVFTKLSNRFHASGCSSIPAKSGFAFEVFAMAAFFPETIDFPENDIGPLATAIGGLVLIWGTTEAGLNICVAAIFTAAGGKHHAKEIPRNLSGKLKFLRRCLRKIKVLEPYKEEGLKIFSVTGQLGAHRNAIVHGFISEYDARTEKFTFTGLGSEGGTPLITGQPKYTIGDIRKIGEDCMVHAPQLAGFSKRLVNAFVG